MKYVFLKDELFLGFKIGPTSQLTSFEANADKKVL